MSLKKYLFKDAVKSISVVESMSVKGESEVGCWRERRRKGGDKGAGQAMKDDLFKVFDGRVSVDGDGEGVRGVVWGV